MNCYMSFLVILGLLFTPLLLAHPPRLAHFLRQLDLAQLLLVLAVVLLVSATLAVCSVLAPNVYCPGLQWSLECSYLAWLLESGKAPQILRRQLLCQHQT